jgi:hypothetical protein
MKGGDQGWFLGSAVFWMRIATHQLWCGTRPNSMPAIRSGKDVPSIIAELKKFAAERRIPKGEMIMGYGYDDTVMPDGRLLNRGDLDETFPDNPVRVDHVSMHGAVMNSLALKKYGISAATKTPPGGVIVRKPGTEEPGLIGNVPAGDGRPDR